MASALEAEVVDPIGAYIRPRVQLGSGYNYKMPCACRTNVSSSPLAVLAVLAGVRLLVPLVVVVVLVVTVAPVQALPAAGGTVLAVDSQTGALVAILQIV